LEILGDCAEEIVGLGGLEPILAGLSSRDQEVQCSSTAALANFATTANFIYHLTQTKSSLKSICTDLLKLMEIENETLQIRAAWAMANILSHSTLDYRFLLLTCYFF